MAAARSIDWILPGTALRMIADDEVRWGSDYQNMHRISRMEFDNVELQVYVARRDRRSTGRRSLRRDKRATGA
jgi:hypothetical protein